MYFDFRLWSLTKGVRLRIAFAVLFGLATAAAGVARLALLGWLIGEVIDGREVATLASPVAGLAGVVVLRGALQFFKEDVAHQTAALVQVNIRSRLHDKAVELGPAYFDEERTGDAIISLVDGVEQLETFFGQYLPQFFVALLTPIGLFLFMMFLDLPTAGVLLGFALAILLLPSAFHRWNRASSERRRRVYGEFGADFLDSIQGLGALKAFGQSVARGRLLAERAREVFRSTMWVLATNALSQGFTYGLIAIGAATALGLGAYRVNNGEMQLSVLLVILMLGVEVFRPLRELSQLYHQGMLGVSAASGIFRMLDAEPVISDNPDAERTGGVEPTVQFEDVWFSYPGGRAPAHRGLTFRVDKGERVGIVGESGSGKTTIVKLLLRLFDPDDGRVLVGGHDLRDLRLDAVRSNIAVVSQDTYLFHGTVAENLRFGNPEASQAQLEQAARTANAHSFIANLPNGYDTLIGERGVKLSGGQRQRVAIARALLRDAPILVLDEALSAVDAENESVIQEALDALMRGRTTLVIAHRLSSIINSDRILVLEEGRVAGAGTHSELLKQNRTYAELMAEQVTPEGRPATREGRGGAADDVPREDTEFADQQAEMAPTEGILKAEGMTWLQTFGVLLKLAVPWKWKLTLTFLLGVGKFGSLIGVGVMSALAVAAVKDGEPFEWLLAGVGGLAVSAGLLTWLENWVAHDMAFRLLAEMRVDLFWKLEKLAPAYLVRRRTGDLVSTATQDVELIEYFFAHTIAPGFVAVVVPFAVTVTLLIFGWPLALTLLPFLVIGGALPFLGRARVDRLGSQSREELGELNAHAVDTLQGLSEIYAFQRGRERSAEFVQQARRAASVRVPFFRELTLQRVYLEITLGLGGLAVASVGAWMVSNGQLDSGLLPLATLLSMSAFLPVSEISHTARQLADTLGSTRRVYAIHNEPAPVVDGPGVELPEPSGNAAAWTSDAAALEMRHVTFYYETMRRPALEDVSFQVPAGQTVAIVGPSGAGKTTAAHLFLRFWDPAEGAVCMYGHDLREYRLEEMRRHIALVSQDTYLFNASLRENVLIAKAEATGEELEQALRQASLWDFVESLPDGVDTVVGERGTRLSGGQRQRVAIARAFLKDAPILVLDEATSHLDAVNERAVHETLDRLMADRTTVVIAHRLSTVRNADSIVVLQDGRVVETGPHNELVRQDGLYAHLVATQMGGSMAAGG